MDIERMEVQGISVKNLEEAMRFFSELLGITFVTWYEKVDRGEIKREVHYTEHADPNARAGTRKIKAAMDRTGFLELIETDPPVEEEGLRNFHFKVPNIEVAKAEMIKRGIRLIGDVHIGGMKEAIFHPDDLYGATICLVEYTAPSLADALLEEG
jgi:catechol 2,3-dioxygenase-like lactoylglutathione lyase family enzyme